MTTHHEASGSESKSGFDGRIVPIAIVASLLLMSLMLPNRTPPAEATPVFAQAYGLNCSACHVLVPNLNAFGRYIQRTGFAALNDKALSHALPVFLFDPGTSYTYQGDQPSKSYRISDPLQTTILYAVGAVGPKVRYHLEQGITLGGQPGFLVEGWVSYTALLGDKGHVLIGKLVPLNLDKFGSLSLLSDITDDALPLQFVSQGVHNYYYDYSQSRWGAEYNIVEPKYSVELSYLGNDSNTSSFGNAYDFSRGANRSVQFKTAYADPSRPWEAGMMGEVGTYGWTGTAFPGTLHQDRYAVVGPYFMKDQRPGSPGFRAEYQASTDSDTGYLLPAGPNKPPTPSGATHGSWMMGSVYQNAFSDRALVNVTYFHTNSALGPLGSPFGPFTGFVGATAPKTAGELGLSYAITPYVRVYGKGSVVKNQPPIFALDFWLTPPLRDRR